MGCVAATARGNGSHLWLLLLGDPCLQARVTAIQEFEVSVSDDQRNLSALPLCEHVNTSRVAPLYVDGRPLYKCDDCGARFVYEDDEPSDKALASLRMEAA